MSGKLGSPNYENIVSGLKSLNRGISDDDQSINEIKKEMDENENLLFGIEITEKAEFAGNLLKTFKEGALLVGKIAGKFEPFEPMIELIKVFSSFGSGINKVSALPGLRDKLYKAYEERNRFRQKRQLLVDNLSAMTKKDNSKSSKTGAATVDITQYVIQEINKNKARLNDPAYFLPFARDYLINPEMDYSKNEYGRQLDELVKDRSPSGSYTLRIDTNWNDQTKKMVQSYMKKSKLQNPSELLNKINKSEYPQFYKDIPKGTLQSQPAAAQRSKKPNKSSASSSRLKPAPLNSLNVVPSKYQIDLRRVSLPLPTGMSAIRAYNAPTANTRQAYGNSAPTSVDLDTWAEKVAVNIATKLSSIAVNKAG
jgi:hypothetical protein